MADSGSGGGAQGKVGPSGTLAEVVIHKDGSKEPVKPSIFARLVNWLKGT